MHRQYTTAVNSGKLHIVATPIGNLEDITLRAITVLRNVDIIACEDTRHSGKLLKHYGARAKLVSYHDHNKRNAAPELVRLMSEGANVALITDAGTPGISDPAYLLVNLSRESCIEVVAIPGPCAAIAALSISGLPTDRFVFEGFLPIKAGKRRARLDSLKNETRTLVFYESPHRLLKSLAALSEALGERRCVIAREITKIHEETVDGTLGQVAERFTNDRPRGEFVVLVEGRRERTEGPGTDPD
jgi:16S rRNA (cytidine1402-2'-O)-methyltransferase